MPKTGWIGMPPRMESQSPGDSAPGQYTSRIVPAVTPLDGFPDQAEIEVRTRR